MKKRKLIPDDQVWIHLPTGHRGHIAWEPDGRYGNFIALNGVEFTIFKTEVITLKELEAA